VKINFLCSIKPLDLSHQSQPVTIKELWTEKGGRKGTNVQWPFLIPAQTSKEMIKEFKDEVERLEKLNTYNHLSIVELYDYFEENNTIYIVMEFISDKTLDDIFKQQGKIPEYQIQKYFLQLASALNVIHENNILHRDIKPRNIILRESQDIAVLTGFGVAREFLAGKSINLSPLGTHGYAPIEQYAVRAKRYPSADIYSLCASMYELLTGELPPSAIERVHPEDLLIPPHNLEPSISPLMEKILLKGLEMSPEKRFKNANHLIQELVMI
jgi:eukaryotic-like serine/threonine-protein kinase